MVAMTAVFYIHFWHPNPEAEHARVSLFFVVSGFPITLMLMMAKGPGSSLAWHLAQLTNRRAYLTQGWSSWVTAHLWSLNQLEQFHLIWPMVILFLPQRQAVLICRGLVALAIGLRAVSAPIGDNWLGMVAAFDPIAGSALVAPSLGSERVQRLLCHPAATAAALGLIFSTMLIAPGFGGSGWYRALLVPALAVIVAGAWKGYRGPAGQVLGSRAALLINQFSYGAYIYHMPLWWLMAEYSGAASTSRGC